MLNFYDFEVFSHNWMVVIVNPVEKTETVIVDDPNALEEYYNKHKNEIWVGYNSKHYDQWILKGILCGFNPKKINDFIIVKGKDGWQFSSMFRNIPLYNYDVMNATQSLKLLEGYMGHNIKETSVPFDVERKLNAAEIAETIEYCKHDVYETLEIFLRRKDDFNTAMGLIKTFNLPLSFISKSKPQMSAAILECNRVERDDEWDIQLVDTLRIKKYKEVVDWFSNVKDYSESLKMDIAGVPHTFAFGGLHAGREKYHAKGFIIHVDVNSFYPAIMIEYDLLSRNVKNKDKYREIRDLRIKYKKEKNPLQAPYKIVLNSTYGICKDKYSPAYDPRQANNICINGQLLLLDLIEHLEVIKSFELINSNTDGLIIKIDESDFDLLDDICYEWESRTKMSLGFDYIKEIWQKDVNNYIFVDIDGKLERKGAYVKELNDLDNDLPIINKALVDKMTRNIEVETTIYGCNDIKEFQMIARATSAYSHVIYNGEKMNEKCFRIFASTRDSDGGIYKVSKRTGKPEKMTNSPEKCFYINDDLKGVEIPPYLDRNWYIQLANKRLKDFGVI